MKPILLCTLLALWMIQQLPTSLASGPTSTAPLTLAQALELALTQSPQIRAATRSRDITASQTRQATAHLLPSLDFTATQGVTGLSPRSTPSLTPSNDPWTSNLSLSLTENLYDNGASLTKRKIALLNEQIEELRLNNLKSTLALDLSKQFYQHSLLSHLLKVQKEQEVLIEKQYEQVSALYRQGLKTYKDFLRLKTKLQAAKITSLDTESSIRISRFELLRLLGQSEDDASSSSTPLQFEVLPARPTDSPDLSFLKANRVNLKQHPETQIEQIQLEISAHQEALASRNLWPRITATAQAMYSYADYLGPASASTAAGVTSWNALLKLDYNLWDWGIRSQDKAQALYRREIQEATVVKTSQSVRSKFEGLLSDLNQARLNYQLNQDLLKLSQEGYDLVDQEYRMGKVSYLDLINGLDDLLKAQTQFLTAHFTLLSNLASYRYFEGSLYETILKKP